MRLVDVIANDGVISLSPGGQINNEEVSGEVSAIWFETAFPDLANSLVPLSEEKLSQLKSIDKFWSKNAIAWHEEGLI